MNNSKSEARVLAEAAFAAASQCRDVKRLISAYIARTNPARMLVGARSDGEKYRWIRGHLGHRAIADAIAQSDRDREFDDRIDAAMARPDHHEMAPPAAPDPVEPPDQPGRLRLANVDFLDVRPAGAAPSPAARASRMVECRFDDSADAACFCVRIDDALVHASIGASVLRSHYGDGSPAMTLFERHATALVEAVRDRVSGGSIEPIVLREYDLK